MGTRRTLRRGMMPLLALVGLLGVLLLAWQPAASALTPLHYDELEFSTLPDIELPAYERYELPNGLVVYLLEDHELPLVSGTATFRTGSRFEPADKVGLASITGEAMRLGGTTRLDADALNQQLEQRAAAIETSIDTSDGSASFSSLTEDAAAVFALFADVVQRPAFADDQVDLLKQQTKGSIVRRNDDPDSITSREFRKLVYGADSPYARIPEYATLAAISRDDIQRFYQASIRPERTILGVVGDFDSAQMKQWIAEYFGDWSPSGVGLGGLIDYPDHAALSVMNEVLNGFGGRLFNEVRSRQGLAYSVYAFWAPRYDYPGLFIGGGQTRSEATVPFIRSTLAEINRMRTQAITATELAQAQDSVLNSFVFNFQSADQILARLIRYEYYDYPQDFVFQFQDQVRQTTAAEVLAAAQDRLRPEQLVILVVGSPTEIQPSLDTLDPDTTVNAVDITIPQA